MDKMKHLCRICNNATTVINDFGPMPIANGFLTEAEFKNEYFFPLQTAFCDTCKTFQLVEQPDPEMMFHENYAFFSGTSKKMAVHFAQMADTYDDRFLNNKKDPFVVELGSNDGIMLKNFAAKNTRHLGIEPSKNVADVATKAGVNTLCAFFSKDIAQQVYDQHGAADIISAANVMCHIPDLASVGAGVKTLLKKDGVFVFEDPYLLSMIEKTAYDQVYDEHVYIFSILNVENIFAPFDLEIFDAEPQTTHGGSMRYYLGFKGQHKITDAVKKYRDQEKAAGLDKIDTYHHFKTNCEKNKKDLVDLLEKIKKSGKRVVGYAATSKSTTILNYCGIGPDLIEYISDTTPIKQGKFSPGKHIPVKAYDQFQKNPPDYAILFAWNHAEEILAKEKDFINGGGKWIYFVPDVRVVPS